jgi:hypothetical protein
MAWGSDGVGGVKGLRAGSATTATVAAAAVKKTVAAFMLDAESGTGGMTFLCVRWERRKRGATDCLLYVPRWAHLRGGTPQALSSASAKPRATNRRYDPAHSPHRLARNPSSVPPLSLLTAPAVELRVLYSLPTVPLPPGALLAAPRGAGTPHAAVQPAPLAPRLPLAAGRASL